MNYVLAVLLSVHGGDVLEQPTVDLVEFNTFYYDTLSNVGTPHKKPMRQVILWRWHPRLKTHVIAQWFAVKKWPNIDHQRHILRVDQYPNRPIRFLNFRSTKTEKDPEYERRTGHLLHVKYREPYFLWLHKSH